MRRIVVHLSGTTGGSALEFAELHTAQGWPGIGWNLLVGSSYPRLGWAGPPSKMFDGRVEMGRDPELGPVANLRGAGGYAFDPETLAICVVAESKESVSRRQAQVAAQLVYGWKREYRIRVDCVVGSPLIEAGAVKFDMDEFRNLVAHWERSSLILLRSFRSTV